MDDIADLSDQLDDVDHIKLFFIDLNGRLMNLSVNKNKLKDIMKNGVGFDGSSIAGYASVEHSDRLLVPDLLTYKKINLNNIMAVSLLTDRGRFDHSTLR